MLDRITRYGLFAVVALAPLLFGGARDWVWGPLAVIIGLLVLARSVAVWTDGEAAYIDPRWLAVPGLCAALVFAWIVVQLVSAAPLNWQNPFYRAAGEALGGEVTGRIAIDSHLALSAATRLLSYVGAFWLAVSVCGDARHARRLLLFIAVSATIYAVYGLVNDLTTGSRLVLWYMKPSTALRLSSVYVNPDNYATYAGMALLVMLAVLAPGLSRAVKRGGSDRRSRWRHGLEFIAGPGTGWLLAGLLIAATLMLSASRAGITATAIGAIVLLAGLPGARERSPARWLMVMTLLILGLGVIVWLAGSRFLDTLWLPSLQFSFVARAELYGIASAAIATAPWLGWGLGGFVWVYPAFQPATGAWPESIFDLAHTTPMEAAIDLGVPAAIVLHVMVLWLVALCVRGATSRRQDGEYPMLAVAASVLVGLHGLADFPLQIPGTAIIYAAILGAGVSQAWSSRLRTE